MKNGNTPYTIRNACAHVAGSVHGTSDAPVARDPSAISHNPITSTVCKTPPKNSMRCGAAENACHETGATGAVGADMGT